MWVVFRDLFPLYRELVLHSVNVGVLGALFTFGAAPRPQKLGTQAVHMACDSAVFDIFKTSCSSSSAGHFKGLTAVLLLLLLGAICCLLAGVQDLYGTPSLGLCPSTPNCISTAEEANMSEDVNGGKSHCIPQW